jgi:hypothetical protein
MSALPCSQKVDILSYASLLNLPTSIRGCAFGSLGAGHTTVYAKEFESLRGP